MIVEYFQPTDYVNHLLAVILYTHYNLFSVIQPRAEVQKSELSKLLW